ncbi:hypothetical protein [Paraburkholderia sp. GAS32]|uniref:hypothetical protein n=1 Tax=Paraburkholderia sp. GAS32 TaxID=3035129 RepID=UPI003D256339
MTESYREIREYGIGMALFLGVSLLITFLIISHTSIDDTVPVGTVSTVERFPGSDMSGVAVVGGRLGVVSAGSPDRALVVTDKGRYMVDGLASSLAPGMVAHLRTSADHTRYLCPASDYQHCYQVQQ